MAAALRADSARLTEACARADQLSGIQEMSVDKLRSFMAISRAERVTFDPSSMSIAKTRWLKAVKRVLLQNEVKYITVDV